MPPNRKLLAFPICLALTSSPMLAATAEGLLTGILFAKNDLENATKTERDGVIALCHEASENEYSSQFWNDLSMDCTEFVASLMVEAFGRSISSTCMDDMKISQILEASQESSGEALTIGSIKVKLAMGAVLVAQQTEHNTLCVDAMKKVYFSMPDLD